MNHRAISAIVMACIALSACGKKKDVAPVAPPVVTAAPASLPPPVPSAEPTAEQREKARKQEQMDFATMEDKYMNDTRAQWATSASASTTFGDDNGKTPSSSSLAENARGPADGNTWTNNRTDIGFDTLELGYAKPVTATEVRVVMPSGSGVEAISKIELRDTSGKWTTAWSGLSDTKSDQRGRRTWFTRTFAPSTVKADGVRVTFANNVERSYKVVDAVQLVGD